MTGDLGGIADDTERTEPVTADPATSVPPSAAGEDETSGSHGALHRRGTTGRAGAARALPGAPVPEPVEEPSPELLAQMFKPPIDARRRAPASPFPAVEEERPREGVRSSLPVMYGRRGEKPGAPTSDNALSTAIGDPPTGYALPAAARSDLPTLTTMNRRFGILAFGGAAAVSILAVAGVCWIATALL